MKVFTAPEKIESSRLPNLFLAGSIEMGKADNWQDIVIDSYKDLDICILNPRRKHWDNSLEQSINNPVFKEQVVWELDGLDSARFVMVYLQPKTYSPISLLEIGLYCKSTDKILVVCCPDGFYRKGNVQIVCKRFGIPLVDDFGHLIAEMRKLMIYDGVKTV